MNKGIMFLWGSIIVLILGFILFVGYRQRDSVYLDLETSLEKASKKYIDKNYKNLKFNQREVIFINELLEEELIKEESLELIDKYCIKSVVFTKGLINDRYSINIDCENEE